VESLAGYTAAAESEVGGGNMEFMDVLAYYWLFYHWHFSASMQVNPTRNYLSSD
jgi:hypothetical protein